MHDLPDAGLRLPPALEQQRELLIAADERGHARSAQRRETPLDGAGTTNPERALRAVEALERVISQIVQLEEPAQQPPRVLRNRDLAWRRQRLEARGKVGRLADDRLLLRRALADQLADDNQPRGDPDPRRKRFTAGVASRATAAVTASPARTARSAASSCARGQPK